MKLIVWKAEHCAEDCYSVRARTKKECIALVAEYGVEDYVEEWGDNAGKVEILRLEYEFDNLFDCYDSLSSEGGAWAKSKRVYALPISRFTGE